MINRASLPLVLSVCVLAVRPAGAQSVSLAIDPDRVVNRVDEKIYGHFLEHIYHAVNGGLWGEMVWDRSFEEWRIPRERGGPPRQAPLDVARHWTFYGEGQGSR